MVLYNLRRHMLSLFVLLGYLFLYFPIFVLVAYSFNQGEFPGAWKGFSLVWYYDLFASLEIWRALYNSILVACGAVICTLILAVLLVYGGYRLRKPFISLFYTNLLIPDIVLAVGMLALFAYFVIPLGLTTLVIGHTVLGLGFAVPLIHNRLQEMDVRLIEASRDLGATELYTFFRVVLPFLYPSLFVSALLVTIVSFDDFLIAFFCAGSSAQTLSLYIFSMIRAGVSPTVNALSTLILGVSSILVLLISRYNIWRQT